MRVLGYGEDALTFWALSQRLGDLLGAFDDTTPAADALVLYHPSFGRTATGAMPTATQRAEFGEFDAVVGTRAAVYLIESKWYRSGELDGDALSLRAGQARRHAILRTYLTLWRESRPSGGDWSAFSEAAAVRFDSELARAAARFDLEPPRVRFAPTGSRLAENLRFVLTSLAGMGDPIVDVALYLRPRTGAPGAGVTNRGFRCVTLDYEVVPGSHFVQLLPPAAQ